MLKSGEEILAELDATLEQLLLNAQTIHHISVYSLSESEMRAMQRTQESLLARFFHTNELLNDDERKNLSEKKPANYQALVLKLKRFGKLNASFIDKLSDQFGEKKEATLPDAKLPATTQPSATKKPRIGRNRKTLKVG